MWRLLLWSSNSKYICCRFLLIFDIIYHFCHFFSYHLVQLLFPFTLARSKFVPNLVCLLNLQFVFLIALLITRWIDEFISSHTCTFKFKSLLEQFLPLDFSLLRRHLYRLASKNSVLNFLCPFFDHLLPFGVVEIKHSESIPYYVFLNFVIQTAVCSKTRRCVDLKQVRSKFWVNKNVKTENLEAHWVIETLWLTHFVQMTKIWLRCYESFHTNIFDLIHEIYNVTALTL